MSRKWKRTEGGHKGGHSNMAHWSSTEDIKASTKIERRHQDKAACADDQLSADETTPASGSELEAAK